MYEYFLFLFQIIFKLIHFKSDPHLALSISTRSLTLSSQVKIDLPPDLLILHYHRQTGIGGILAIHIYLFASYTLSG